MINISDTDKVKALREITDCGIIDCKDAIRYCKDHPDCNEVGYLMSKSFAVVTRCTEDERIRHFSKYAESHICGIHWKKFLETGDMSNI